MNALCEPPPNAAAPPWWVRILGRIPLPFMYGLGKLIAFVASDVFRYRVSVARENLRVALPELDELRRRLVLHRHYQAFAEVLCELPRVAVMSTAELRARVSMPDLDLLKAEFAAGQSVLLLTAHQCNWEWLLQALALDLGRPFLAAYKPPHSARAERTMLALRGRFGVRMVPGKRLLREVLRRRQDVHAIGMVADQMPTSSGGRIWLNFLGRATAFFPGPAQVARLGGYNTYFLALRRTRRGYYQARFTLLARASEALDTVEFTGRYAASDEAQLREYPADWTWTHRRWKLQPPAPLPSAPPPVTPPPAALP